MKSVSTLRLHPVYSVLTALLAGGLNVFAFAPLALWPLQILSLAWLFWLVLGAPTVRRAALLGAAYSFAHLFFGVSWLLITLMRFNDLPWWLAVPGLALFAAYLAVYAGTATGLARWLMQSSGISPVLIATLILPAFWALSEWLRGWIFTGFPWLSSGYAFTASPLAGYAPLLGVYGIGLLAALLAGCLLHPRYKSAWLLILLLSGGGIGLQQVQWSQPYGKPISVRLLQGNIAQDLKFSAAHLNDSLQLYYDMLTAAPADLVATPETAFPLLSDQLPSNLIPELQAFSRASGSHLILGLLPHDGPNQYANSVLALVPGQNGFAYRYDKHHLVPFGEFTPWGFAWFEELLNVPMANVSGRGLLQPSFSLREQRILPNICYENLFGEEIAAQLEAEGEGKNGSILLNVSNLAWYGDSFAIPQHRQISQMRTLETARPMLSATNTGATAVIDADGKVLAELATNTVGVLQATVQGRQGDTPYIRYGNRLMLGLAGLLILTAWARTRWINRAKITS